MLLPSELIAEFLKETSASKLTRENEKWYKDIYVTRKNKTVTAVRI